MPRQSIRRDDAAGHVTDPELALFDLLGQRWALRVLWELRAGPLTYRAIADQVSGLSTSVLTKRLRELRSAGLVEHRAGSGYQLSARGHGLLGHLDGVANWARRTGFG